MCTRRCFFQIRRIPASGGILRDGVPFVWSGVPFAMSGVPFVRHLSYSYLALYKKYSPGTYLVWVFIFINFLFWGRWYHFVCVRGGGNFLWIELILRLLSTLYRKRRAMLGIYEGRRGNGTLSGKASCSCYRRFLPVQIW